MPKDWETFKRPFKASVQRETVTTLKEALSKAKSDVEVLKKKLAELKLQKEELERTKQGLGSLPDFIGVLTEDIGIREGEIVEQEVALHNAEVLENVTALQMKDDTELDGLTEPETGAIAVKKQELTSLERELEGAGTGEVLAQVDVDDTKLTLHTLISTKFSEIKGLLTTMLEAEVAMTKADTLVEKAREKLRYRQQRYDGAAKLMDDLSTRDDLMRSAVAIVNSFRVETRLLASARQGVELALKDWETKKEAFAEATRELEEAIEEEVQKPEPTETEAKKAHRSLVEAWKEVLEAREKLRLAQQTKQEARTKVQEKEVEVKAIEDRAKMLEARAGVLELGAALSKLLNATPALEELVVWKESASALQETMGETAYGAFAKKGLAFMQGLDGLIALGMKDEDVVTIYTELKWPEKWHPPRMRPQEANWLKVKGSLKDDKIALEQQKKTAMVEALGFAEQNQDTVLSNFGDGMQTIGLLDKDDAEQVTQWLTLVSSVITLGTAGARAVSSTRTLMQTDDSVDPVEQLMLIDEVLSNIGATAGGVIKTAQATITKTGASKIAALVPGLGALNSFGSMCYNACSATQFWVAATADGEVHRKAKEQKHRLEASTDHVQKRGTHVASRKTTQAASDLIAFCGHICTLAGMSAPAGVALSTLSTVVSTSEKAVSWAVDATQMEKARTLLKKAQGGDPEAREEIFREHPYYATAIIALLAEEGDTIALAIYGNHSVTKDMVVRSSAKVLQKYLLRELVEEETATSWSEMGEWFTGIGESISEGFTSALDTLGTLYDSVSLVFKSSPTPHDKANAQLALTRLGATPLSDLQSAVTKYNEAQRTLTQQEEVFSKMNATDTDYTKAKGLVAKWKLEVKKLANKAHEINGKIEQQLDTGLQAVQTLDADITPAGLKRFQELVVIQRQCLRVMTPLL